LNSSDASPVLATPNQSGVELPVRRSTLFLKQARVSQNFILTGVVRNPGIERAAKQLPLPIIGILGLTGDHREDIEAELFQ